MGKTIRKTIQITTRKRNHGLKINEEFYSYDKNNAQFEFIMDYDIPADKVIALFHFENSNRYYETLCTFKGNLITIEFDTSLIVEDELVTGYLYFDKLDKSTDVYRFTFGVRLSEIDKTRELPVQEKVSRRIVPVADIVTKQELKELLDRIQKNGGTYDDTEIRNSISSISERVQTLENKPDNDTRYDDSDVKSRLNALETNASRYLTEHQPLTSIEERIQQVEARFNNLSNIYLSSHQSLEHLATNDALGKIEQRVEQLEQNRGSQPVVDNHDFVTRQELEGKHYLTSVPEEITNKISALENKSVVTHEELESAGYAKTTDLTNLAANSKVEAVESRVQALENKPVIDTTNFATKGEIPQAYNDEEVKRRLSTLEGKTDNFISGVSVNKEGNNVTLTYNYVDGQSKNVSFTDSDTINVAYDDSGIKARLTSLESRPQVDLTDYAKKTELYNDSDIKQRLTALENNHVTKEELHEATELDETQFVSPAELEAKHYLTAQQAESEFAKKSEIPNTTNFATTDSVNNLLRTQGEHATKIAALESKSAYEIHGTGMPNGQVEAPIGTTYVDMAVTNGALKWIKQSGTGNTGWKVLIGDTGWRTLNSVSRLGNSFIKIRRVNNLVTYNFGGLQWGWFGIIRRNGPGFAKHNSTGERGAKVLAPNSIPEGFRSENSLIGGIYNDAGKPYGIWYLGGKSDSNYIQFSFNDPIPTDRDIGDIRVSAISYVTDEDWPTRLP